jgi:hypothetical protein
VSNQAVFEFRNPAARTAVASSNYSFVPGSVVPIADSQTLSRTVDRESEDSDPDGLGCARGLRSAFLLQGAMMVVAYGIWHLWHLAR